ncbi:sugar-binding protein, partial [Streptomyces sp. NPDC096046]
MIATLLQGITAPANAGAVADDGRGRPALPKAERPVAGSAAKMKPRTLERGPRTPRTAPKAEWPGAGSGRVTLTGTPAGAKGSASGKDAQGSKGAAQAPVRAGKLPVSVGAAKTRGAAGAVRVELAGRGQTRKAAIDGLLVTLAPERTDFTDGAARVRVDYRDLAQAYGGGYGARLGLVQLPACVLRTPERAKCRTQKPLESVNDTEGGALTAPSVRLSSAQPTVLAAVADDSAAIGDYKATTLAPSATWQTNLNTGDFAWSYDMGVPEVPGGLKPSIGLGYSSGSV